MKRFLTWLLLKLYGKYTISQRDFLNEVGKIAKEMNEGYFQCTIQMQRFNHDREIHITLTGYINGTQHESGSTVAEVIKKLKTSRNPELKQTIEENVV